jgi:hypothetical protein
MIPPYLGRDVCEDHADDNHRVQTPSPPIRILCEFQSQSTIYHAHDDEKTTIPDVQSSGETLGSGLEEFSMLNEPKDWLDEEHDDDDGPNYLMWPMPKLDSVSVRLQETKWSITQPSSQLNQHPSPKATSRMPTLQS